MKRSELKEIIREEIFTFFEADTGTVSTEDPSEAENLAKKGINVTLTKEDLDDLTGPTDTEVGREKGVATQYDVEMKKQNLNKFMQHMKDIGVISPDGKLLQPRDYRVHFSHFKTNPEDYI